MQLYIIRHGESVNNALGNKGLTYDDYMASRSADPLLTDVGVRQAAMVADHLASNDFGITEICCSAMIRAMQTAQPIAASLGLQPRIWLDIHEHGGIFLGNLRSRSVDSFPGVTRQDVVEHFPGYQYPDSLGVDGWWWDGYEEIAACEVRAKRVAAELEERATREHDAVLALVSHGTFIDRLLKALLVHRENGRHYYYDHHNTAITRLDFLPDGPLILRYTNRTQHLPAGLITD